METEDEAVVDAPDDSDTDDPSGKDNSNEKQPPARDNRYRQRSDFYIAEGFYSDCENILKQFLAKRTSTFEDFVNIWKERKFSLIFNGRDSYAEQLEFSEEALHIAKSFILPPHSQIKRIGALYLMYGLYSQQPYRHAVKYRITPQEWSVILKFVENLKAHGFIDANFIFHKMCLDGAFMTVACSREYGLERNFRKYLISWQARDKELEPGVSFSLETLMGRVYRGSLKSAADKLRSKYNDIKNTLQNKKEANFQSIQGADEELEKVMVENMFCPTDDIVTAPDGTKKFANIGKGRRSIIDKAFALGSVPLDTAGTSAASSSQANSREENLEHESDSDSGDLEYVINPPSMRNNKKLKTKQKKSEERVSSLGKKLKGPRSAYACYEDIVGKKSPLSRNSKSKPAVNENRTATTIEEDQDIDEPCLMIDSDGDASLPAMSEDPKETKLKSPVLNDRKKIKLKSPAPKDAKGANSNSPFSGKNKKKGKQGKSMSVPPADKTDTSSSGPLSLSPVDSSYADHSKNKSRKESGVEKNVTANLSPTPISKDPKEADLKSPPSGKDQGKSVSIPSADNEADPSSSVEINILLSPVVDTTADHSKSKSRRKSAVKKDVTDNLSLTADMLLKTPGRSEIRNMLDTSDSEPTSQALPKKKKIAARKSLQYSSTESETLSPKKNIKRRRSARKRSR